MRSAAVLVFVLVAPAAACSSSKSSSAPQGDGGIGDGATANSITFSMHETVAPSTEQFDCMYVQPSVDRTFFTKIAHTYTPGSHHLLLLPTDLTTIPAGQDLPHDCYAGGADFMTHARGFMYGSQLPEDQFDLPKGVAFFSDPSAVYLLQTHYLNSGASPLEATVTVTLTTSDGSDVTTKAGALFFYDPYIHVPMGGTASAGMRCPIASDVTLLRVIPHTHARGTAFNAFLDPATGAPAAQPFYTSTDWQHPAASPAPMQLAAGSHIRFKCDYGNAMGTQDYFQGPSALDNEMCVFGGVYYPDMGIQVNLCAAPDEYGLGTATCQATGDCLKPCYAMTDTTQATHCVQSCMLASCPSAGTQLAAMGKCGQSNCQAECTLGQAGCIDCIRTKCPAENAACTSATCQ